ncbi:AbiA family abortive infection protein [Lactococcus garvieae]|uniref:AbiA family abortive infection protein n=1 Tax=Lactococcus garvieae TaxID=1363 RepID=A0AA43T7J3_9LACT|nr:AbiA family abortive infection protein [Lactococcus garvieae]MDH7959438.1 AbiA family abortive infection protein [Lactococcus garvieae]BDM76550.1 hypothetical protein LGMS210922A_14950 [Lactococcus garvieae]BDW51818.1 hypothetical protein LG21E68_14930 [Lactococcus garvieae]
MITLEHKDWKLACKMLQNIPKNTKNKYFQTYSFLLDDKNWGELTSEKFFTSYIKSGQFLTKQDNLSFPNRTLQKHSGAYRHVKIVSPIIYLFLIAIACQIKRIYKEDRPKSYISTYFSGSFDEEKPSAHYKSSYNSYLVDINICQDSFDYCFQIDFSTFFPLVDTDSLFGKVEKLDPKSELIYSSLIKMIGQGKMPIVDGNTGLSYLNTVVYLDKFDTELINFLKDIKEIESFQLVRYVDDLAIFINCDQSNLSYLNSKVYTKIYELAVQNRLEINSSKTKYFTSTVELGSNMNVALYDYFAYNESINFDEYYSIDDLKSFLDSLIALSSHATFKEYETVSLATLQNSDLVFGGADVLNAIVYNKNDWAKDEEVIKKIKTLVDSDYKKLRFSTRALITLILNTKDSHIIRSLLNNIFESFKSNNSDLIDEILSIEYLVQRNFQHTDLIKTIKNTNPNLSNYIEKFQINELSTHLQNEHTTFYTIDNKVYDRLDNDSNLNFLFFRYKYFESLGQTLESFAYFKNYFDRFIAHATFCMGFDTGKKPNFRMYYTEKAITKGLNKFKLSFNEDEIKVIIHTAHDIRNDNPVSHASAALIKNSNLSKDRILESIQNLKNIIEEIWVQLQEKKDM